MDDVFVVQADAQTRQFNLSTDLTGRTVETILTHVKDGRRVNLDNEPTIVNASTGMIEHHFTQEDLGQWGTYHLEFRVTGGPDDPTTIPQEKPIEFNIRWSARMIEEISQLRGIDADRIDFEGKTIDPERVEANEIKISGETEEPDSVITREDLERYGEDLISNDTHSHTDRDIDPNRVLAMGSMSRTEVAEGESLTIPEGYCLTVVGPYEVKGELNVDGRIKIV